MIILGSGPAAVSAAFPLLEAGFHVRMVTADEAVPVVAKDSPESIPDVGGLSPKVRTLIGLKGLQAYQQANGIECEKFSAQGSLLSGGLSRVWGVVAPIWQPNDFRGFPFDFSVMAPHYQKVAMRVPWSGEVPPQQAEIAPFRSHEPVPVASPIRRLLRIKKAGIGFQRACNMVARENISEFSPCKLCNKCFQGCEANALYRADKELEKLVTFSNFELLRSFVVKQIVTKNDGSYKIKTIDQKGKHVSFEADQVLVGLGAIASTALISPMLKEELRPKRLYTTPSLAFSFIDPISLITRPRADYALAQISFDVELKDNDDNRAYGTIYRASGLEDEQFLDSTRIPRLLARPLIRWLKPALYIGLVFVPGKFSDNKLCFRCVGERQVMKITGGNQAKTKSVLQGVVRKLLKPLYRAGLFYIPFSMRQLSCGADSHYGGSLPMGSTLDSNGEVFGYPGLYIIDGASLSNLPAKHLTFTIMANADRIGCHVAKVKTE